MKNAEHEMDTTIWGLGFGVFLEDLLTQYVYFVIGIRGLISYWR